MCSWRRHLSSGPLRHQRRRRRPSSRTSSRDGWVAVATRSSRTVRIRTVESVDGTWIVSTEYALGFDWKGGEGWHDPLWVRVVATQGEDWLQRQAVPVHESVQSYSPYSRLPI